mgnify:FL=1
MSFDKEETKHFSDMVFSCQGFFATLTYFEVSSKSILLVKPSSKESSHKQALQVMKCPLGAKARIWSHIFPTTLEA